MSDIRNMTRQMWHLLEPIHASLYYASEAFDEAARLGYSTHVRWPSYFAWRSAPLGSAGPRLVEAAYYSFSPSMIVEHVPAVWSVATPARILEARLLAVDRTLRALLGNQIRSHDVAEAAALAREAAEAANTAGCPLAAANADLPWPSEPHLQLWHAATLLREHRGDVHVSALAVAGLDPCEALVSFAAVGAAPVEVFASRGWNEQEWAAARARLTERGWIDPGGMATDAGIRQRDEVEQRTDDLAGNPWRTLGPRCRRLAQLVAPLTKAVAASGILPRQSTLGIARSTDGRSDRRSAR